MANNPSSFKGEMTGQPSFKGWSTVFVILSLTLIVALVWLIRHHLTSSLNEWLQLREQAQSVETVSLLRASIEEGVLQLRAQTELLSRFVVSLAVLVGLLFAVWLQQRRRFLRDQALALLEDSKQGDLTSDRQKTDELRSQISHELRTPIASVVSCLEAAMTDSKNRNHPAVKRAYGAANDMLEMLNKTLDASRLANDRLILQIDEFSLRNLLSKAIESVDIAAQRKNIELILDVVPDMPDLLFGDSLRLRQILVNLLSNAIKFTEKGEVRLAAKQLPLKGNRVELTFCIQDTGRGMTARQSRNLFAPFAQAEGQSTAQYGGSGLGLYITKQLVVGMGGQIQVHSQRGVGSTFLITLPLQLCQHSKTPVPQIQSNTGLLIVSHNAAQRRVLKSQLERFFAEVKEVDIALKIDLSWIEPLQKVYVVLNLDSLYPDRERVLEKLNLLRMHYSKLTLLTLVNGFLKPQQVKDLEYLRCAQVISKPALPVAILEAIDQSMDEQELEEHVPEVNQLLKGLRILLAEDEITLREITSETLRDWGATVEAVSNGAEAVASVLHSSDRFDVVLMDLAMPYLNGTEATRQIREVFDRDALPIIALTSYNTEVQIQACLESGVNVHQVKPVNFLALARLILRLCRPRESSLDAREKPMSVEEAFEEQTTDCVLLDYSRTLFRGNRDLYVKALERFYLEYLNDRFEHLLDKGTVDKQRVHQLRGAAALIGAQKLSGACANAEKNWHLFNQFERQTVCAELREVLAITGDSIKTKMHKEVNK